MMKIFTKQPMGEKLTLKIEGMHCSSCAMNIDGTLEDTDGVIRANTSYAKSKVDVVYDVKKVSPLKLMKIIEDQGYTVLSNN